jgi:hypothetical protein
VGQTITFDAADAKPIGSTVTFDHDEALPVFRQSDQTPNELDREMGASSPDELERITPNAEGMKAVANTARRLWAGLMSPGQLLPAPKAIGGSGSDHPLMPGGADEQFAPKFVRDMHAVKREADAAWEKGDHRTAAAKYVESVIPLIGPMMNGWGNEAQRHEVSGILGDLLSFVVPHTLNAALPESPARAAAATVSEHLTPEEQASNAFAAEHDIPLDAATATGSRFARGVQRGAGESLLGAPVAERAVARQQRALTATGRSLADQVHPESASPEQAGQGVRDSVTGLVRDLHGQASAEYDKLRAFEADPKYADVVEKAKSGAQVEAMRLEQQRSLGRVPTEPELRELRRIERELDAYGYEGHTFNYDVARQGGTPEIVGGHAGAPVYDDIVGSMDGAPTRAQLQAQIQHALETGNYRSEGAKNAIEVAGRRLSGDRSLASPILPPEAGDTAPRTETMGLAVDVRPVKQSLQPLYLQLKREAELVPLMGDKGRALTALDRLVHGPDHVPLSIADAAASDLKAMARVDEPALRSAGEGKAAFAVRELERAIQTRARAAGPEVADALEFGRSATRGKYQVADILDQIKTEPVRAFDQLTQQRDGGVGLLRKIQDVAPGQIPVLGRAKLEQMLDLATERDRFDHADKLYADWQKLGDQTKQMLFGKDLVPELDKFFLLAKRIAENPNPSGTAPTLLKMGEAVGIVTHPLATLPASLTMGALARVLYTPRGVKALTKLLSLEMPAPGRAAAATVKGAVKQAAVIDLANAARAAGVPWELPKAARPDQDSATSSTPR